MGQELEVLQPPTSLESSLAPRILTPEISDSEIGAYADIFNSHWRSYFPLTPEMFRKRLESGHLFIGVKQDDRPILLLQTLSLDVPLEDIVRQTSDEDCVRIASRVCSKIERAYSDKEGIDLYRRLTNNGNWAPVPSNPNVLWLMDITSIRKVDGTSAADIAIDFVKSLIIKPIDIPVPGNPKKIQIVLTFTPDIEKILYWHLEHYAFDTGYKIPNGRIGYKTAAVNPACYYLNGPYPMQPGRLFSQS